MKGVVGYTHVAIKVREEARTMAFYRDALGFQEMFRLNHADGRLWLAYLRVSDTQYLEVFTEADSDVAAKPGSNGIDHLCFQVEDIAAVAELVKAAGVVIRRWSGPRGGELLPDPDPHPILGQDGNKQFWAMDPDGIRLEFMEIAPGSLQGPGDPPPGASHALRWRSYDGGGALLRPVMNLGTKILSRGGICCPGGACMRSMRNAVAALRHLSDWLDHYRQLRLDDRPPGHAVDGGQRDVVGAFEAEVIDRLQRPQSHEVVCGNDRRGPVRPGRRRIV